MATYGVSKMFCTVCGKQYDWNCHYSWSGSRACGRECHEEWTWREVLSMMGKEYYPRKKESEEKSSLSNDLSSS